MKIKAGVSLLGFHPVMVIALMVAKDVIESYGVDCVITSGIEGEHSKKTSKHYVGCGLDLRTRDMSSDDAENCASDIRSDLGDEFYVAFEKNHIHISYNGSIK